MILGTRPMFVYVLIIDNAIDFHPNLNEFVLERSLQAQAHEVQIVSDSLTSEFLLL
jgi:hypothetical protein